MWRYWVNKFHRWSNLNYVAKCKTSHRILKHIRHLSNWNRETWLGRGSKVWGYGSGDGIPGIGPRDKGLGTRVRRDRYSMIWSYRVLYDMIDHYMTVYDAIWYCVIWYTILWNCMRLYGAMRFYMIWYDRVGYYMILFGTISLLQQTAKSVISQHRDFVFGFLGW